MAMIGFPARNVHNRVKSLVFEIVERELSEEGLQRHVQSLGAMPRTEMAGELMRRIVQMIQTAVDVDPKIQEGQKKYIPDIRRVYGTDLFLRLQSELGVHPFEDETYLARRPM